MIKFLFLVLILFSTAYADFDGVEVAKRVIARHHQRGDQFTTICQDYFSELRRFKSKEKLSEKDEPEILGGYLAITCYFHNENQEARKELLMLADQPNRSKYKELLATLNQSSTQFGQCLTPKKNFSLSVVEILNNVQKRFGTKFPLDMRVQLSLMSDEKMADIVKVSELENEAEKASHRIMSGSFGFKRRSATSEEKETMIQFLLDSVERAIKKKDLASILTNYDLKYAQDASRSPQMKKHISLCRSILASVYYILSNEANVFTPHVEQNIRRLIGAEWLTDLSLVRKTIFETPKVLKFLNDRLDGFAENNLAFIPEPLKKKLEVRKEHKFSAEFQVLYNSYVRNPTKFDEEITKDANQYTRNHEASRRELVFNVINFYVATQTSKALDNLRIYAEIPDFHRNYFSYDSRFSFTRVLELDNSDQDCSTYDGYCFKLDREKVKEALLAKKPINTLIWLEQLISPQVLKSSQYNLSKVRQKVKSFWQNLYETLVYAYVFAKEQKKEKAFFNNAFPTEIHCSDSLVSVVQTWLKTEKESLGKDPAKIAKAKLSTQTKELIEANNVFIGAIVKNFILYWLAPKYLDWSRSEGKKISLEDIEANPEDTLMLYPDIATLSGIPTLSQDFSRDVGKLIEDAAKARAVEVFNTKRYDFYSHDSYSFSTTDNDLTVLFTVNLPFGTNFQNPPKIKVSDIGKVKVIKNRQLMGLVLSKDMPLEQYLKLQFRRFFGIFSST